MFVLVSCEYKYILIDHLYIACLTRKLDNMTNIRDVEVLL